MTGCNARVRAAMLGLALCLAVAWSRASALDLRGHGGPVRAIALSDDGRDAVTASFDSTVIVWSLAQGQARRVLRFHQGAVNTVVMLAAGRFATAGEDGRIALWDRTGTQPGRVLSGHSAPVVSLAASGDGTRLVSASWDGTARLWSLESGTALILADHRANVNGAAFLASGQVVTAAYDGQLRLFSASGALLRQWALGVPASGLLVTRDDEIVLAMADGSVRFADVARGVHASISVSEAPIVALAASRDGALLAAAGFRGALALIDRAGRRLERRMDGPAFPLWSLAFSPDGREVLTGGADRLVRRWSVATGEPVQPLTGGEGSDVPARLKDHPGAVVFRACSACHTLTPADGNRARPSLHGLFGRRIASLAGYDYSPELRTLDIVWTRETLGKLFELGPAAYTPGSKMPEQRVIRAEDREALADFLAEAQAMLR